MKIRYVVFFLLFLPVICAQAQHDDWYYGGEVGEEEGMSAIISFEKYNPLVGGDSIRLCNGRRCTGNIVDKHPNGKMLHKGYYTNGQLLNGYENYFDNGQMERKFKVTAPNKGSVIIYYSDGTIRSEIEYLKNQILLWKDYYSNGNIEFWEEYDKSLEYYVTYNFYYINGNPQSTMTLRDKKNKIYDAAEYFSNGNVKSKGDKKWAPGVGGYVKIGTWTIYDINGNVVRTEYFEAGTEASDDDFFDEN
jgi:antitoxin component YwqK of YwqJK toxin-antitoxin module